MSRIRIENLSAVTPLNREQLQRTEGALFGLFGGFRFLFRRRRRHFVRRTAFGSLPFGPVPFGATPFGFMPFGSVPFGPVPFGPFFPF